MAWRRKGVAWVLPEVLHNLIGANLMLHRAILAILLAVALGAAPLPHAVANGGCTATMWAGQHHDAGTVTVRKEQDALVVTYQTNAAWRLTEIHLEVAGDLADIPQNRGGPIPGRFTHKAVVDGSAHTVVVPCADLPAGELVIAAHAVVAGIDGDSEECIAEQIVLPDGSVHACFEFPGVDTFARVTLTDAGDLNGLYGAWCVDMDRGLGGCDVDVTMVSSLEPLADLLVDRPENLDVLNYILNQDYSALGAGRDEIQAAIWGVIDDKDWMTGGGVLPNPFLTMFIIEDALQNGHGFVPGPGDFVAIILEPRDELQTTIIKLRVPDCPPPSTGGSETAWAGDLEFPGKNWARYFTCAIR